MLNESILPEHFFFSWTSAHVCWAYAWMGAIVDWETNLTYVRGCTRAVVLYIPAGSLRWRANCVLRYYYASFYLSEEAWWKNAERHVWCFVWSVPWNKSEKSKNPAQQNINYTLNPTEKHNDRQRIYSQVSQIHCGSGKGTRKRIDEEVQSGRLAS